MRVAIFCHSLASCWNHGNAHFLRGIARALLARGHEVVTFEPEDGWSRLNLLQDHGAAALEQWRSVYPELTPITYRKEALDLDRLLDGVDLVLVHEWNEPTLARAVGEHRTRCGTYRLLFHDTHHRIVSDTATIEAIGLDLYDGVLAFGRSLAERYRELGWGRRVWVWHEAADLSVFKPLAGVAKEADVAWVGNWGDGERSDELGRFLLDPIARAGLSANVWGVRYPAEAIDALASRRIAYHGWLANHRVPEVFARHKVTVHVPRRFYADALPGIPTIRVFEALACGIPLVSAPWQDEEGLFDPGSYWMVRDGDEMADALATLCADPALAQEFAARGQACVRARHSCAHRVDELERIHDELAGKPSHLEMELQRCA
jgi:spore maturation protein CgeB